MSIAKVSDLVVGVDTHRDTHSAAICDARGRVLSQRQVPATPAGYADLLAWAAAAGTGQRLAWAIEGTRHYGLGLARLGARLIIQTAARYHQGTGQVRSLINIRAPRSTTGRVPSRPEDQRGQRWTVILNPDPKIGELAGVRQRPAERQRSRTGLAAEGQAARSRVTL